MGPISLDISIDARRERVFECICDLSRRPSWAGALVSDLRLERLEGAGRGAAARFRVGAPGGIRYMETVLTEIDPPHTVIEHGRGGHLDRIPIRTAWELVEGQGSVTDVTLTFWTEPAAILDRLRELGRASRWWRRRWRKALKALRDQLESADGLPEPVGVAGGDRPASLAR